MWNPTTSRFEPSFSSIPAGSVDGQSSAKAYQLPPIFCSSDPTKSPTLNGKTELISPVSSLQVVTTLYNPCKSRRINENYLQFRRGIRETINAYAVATQDQTFLTIELALEKEPFFLRDRDLLPTETLLQVRASNRGILFQKERLFNLALERGYLTADCIAWIDSDVLFDNTHWIEQALKQLNKCEIIQLFELVYRPGNNVEEDRISRGLPAWMLLGPLGTYPSPGYAWAARSDWLKAIDGLYDKAIMGGGDTVIASHLCRRIHNQPLWKDGWDVALRQDAQAWADKMLATQPMYSYIPGLIKHLWHGTMANRRYIGRETDIKSLIPSKHLFLNSDGVYEFTPEGEEQRLITLNHFKGRQDDG